MEGNVVFMSASVPIMIRNREARRAENAPPPNRESRRYGPHRISYKHLEELKYYRDLHIKDFDLCDYSPFHLYKKFLDDETLFGEVNTDDEENAEEEEINNEIHVKSIDLKMSTNAFNHHTNDYKCIRKREVEGKDEEAVLVIRRGQVFNIDMTFSQEYDAKKHDLKLQFKLGMDPSALRGTEITILMDEEGNKFDNSGKWQARVTNKMPAKELEIEVISPPNCVIGDWDLHVYTISKDKRGKSKSLHYEHVQDIVILFNPWCKEDTVYFPADPDYETKVDPRLEYVLNPTGAVYRTGQLGKPWRYGQFDEGILQLCLKLVRRYFGGVVDQKMGNAIYVSRAISLMCNSTNGGVLTGRWDGKYDDGATPSSWSGTPKILRQFRDKGAVKYGQCWVFSAVTVTVCRALGIPCRSITNFSSAHDVDKTNEIERIISDNGSDYESLKGDSVWNFHVWNEAWMTREDTENKKYDGWQVIDATPQEESDGKFQCGPCPVRAVKDGFTYLPYDTDFVTSETNADIAYYQIRPGNKFRRVKTKKNSVGKYISTKIPDGEPMEDSYIQRRQRHDVTNLYKHQEGSNEERTAVARARRFAGNELAETEEEVSITIKTKKDGDIDIGEDIEVVAVVKNTSPDKENRMKISSMRLRISSIDYTGNKRIPIKSIDKKDFYINPDEEQSFDMKVTWDEYKDKRQDMADFSVTAIVAVTKSGNTFPENEIITLRNPAFVKIDARKECKVGETIDVTFSVTNPIPMTLTKCILGIDDEKFEDHVDIDFGNIAPKATESKTVQMTTIRPGTGQIIAVLDTKELPDITGSVNVKIAE